MATQTIVKLQAENIKRLKAIEITPDGNVVIVGGPNSAGKTSLLDSITMAFAGGRSIPDEPIRKGERKAVVVAETEELVVTRKFTHKGSTLEVKGKDGVKLKSPQSVLDKLVGELTFDPLAFARLEPEKQNAVLRSLAECDVTEIEQKRAIAYSRRTDVGRDVQAVKARMDASPFHEGAPEQETSVGELLSELQRRKDANEDRRRQREALEQMRTTAVELKTEIAEAEKRLADLKGTLMQAVDAGKRQAARVAELGEDDDWQEVKDRIDNLETENKKARENAEHLKLVAEWENAVAHHDALTSTIKDLDEQKAARLAQAKFPVPGLGFGETGITLNGLPFEQAGQAEQIRVSVAMGLALNPTLRVLLVRDGSLLDETSLSILAELAAKAEAQVWIERVGDGDECSVVIENGEMKP